MGHGMSKPRKVLTFVSLIDFTNDVTLVDAKYSVAKETPSPEYQYQQFFYAVKWAVKKNPLKEWFYCIQPLTKKKKMKIYIQTKRGWIMI